MLDNKDNILKVGLVDELNGCEHCYIGYATVSCAPEECDEDCCTLLTDEYCEECGSFDIICPFCRPEWHKDEYIELSKQHVIDLENYHSRP